MDLTTLVTACSLMVDPKIMHALIWRQSGGEPWAFTVSGRSEPQVLQNPRDALDAVRGLRPDDVAVRVGLAGVPATPRSVTAAMFAPCSNIGSAARQIAQLAERCRTSSRSKDDPILCAIAAWHGSWERPDKDFADAVRTSAKNDDAPDFEMPAGAMDAPDGGPSRQPAAETATATPSATPDDGEQALTSPLFPVMSRPSGGSPISNPAGSRPASDERKADPPAAPPAAARPHADGLFVPRTAPRSAPGSQ